MKTIRNGSRKQNLESSLDRQDPTDKFGKHVYFIACNIRFWVIYTQAHGTKFRTKYSIMVAPI